MEIMTCQKHTSFLTFEPRAYFLISKIGLKRVLDEAMQYEISDFNAFAKVSMF